VDRKEFMRDVYANYWLTARERKYGFLNYDKELCDFLSRSVKEGSSLLEVAIGTGYPVADFLQKSGYAIHGIDISPALVERCRALNPAIVASVGDAEHLEFEAESFDAAYCFHSSWYFPNLIRVIDEMLRVTRPGGLVVFDIQNRDHPVIAADYVRRLAQVRPGLLARANLHARNLAKMALRRGNPNWHAVVYEVPTLPGLVLDHLESHEVKVMGRREDDQSLVTLDGATPLSEYLRLVFALRR
jgi:SAM-dependent methyltransferase